MSRIGGGPERPKRDISPEPEQEAARGAERRLRRGERIGQATSDETWGEQEGGSGGHKKVPILLGLTRTRHGGEYVGLTVRPVLKRS